MTAARTKTVLLTGASGVIGKPLAQRLRPNRVIGLVHSDHEVGELDDIVVGDIATPRFGLDQDAWSALCDEIDIVVHSAALTEWGQPDQRYEQINVQGTCHVIDAAIAASSPVHYVSTCFVKAIEDGRESELSASNVVRPYIASKLKAESLLAESGLAYSVYRPTNLVGDEMTGESVRPQIVQMMSQ